MENPSKSTALQKSVAAMVIALLLLASLFCVRVIGAEVILISVQYQISTWLQRGQVPAEEQWLEARDQISLAKRLNPYDMQFDLTTAEIHEWRSNIANQELSTDDWRLAGEAILKSYRTAIEARPQWPYTWAFLARQKAYMGQIDAEFETALRNVDSMGRWLPPVQFLITETAAVSWPKLNSDMRQLVVENIERSQIYYDANSRRQMRFMQYSNLLPAVCPFIDFSLVTIDAERACTEAMGSD